MSQEDLQQEMSNWILEYTGVAGFLGYPQPGGGAHPPIPRGCVLGEELGDGAESTLAQGLKNTRFRVVRAAGA